MSKVTLLLFVLFCSITMCSLGGCSGTGGVGVEADPGELENQGNDENGASTDPSND